MSPFGFGGRVSGPISGVVGPGYGPDVKEHRVSSYFVELLISTEPRLRIVGGEGAVERLKAVDGKGRSVLREPSAEERRAQAQLFQNNPHLDPKQHPELRFGSWSVQSTTAQIRRIPLAESAPPGGRLGEFQGVISVAVMARRADPIVMPLADAKEKTIEKDGVRLTVHEAVVKPNYFAGELELSLETERPAETLRVQGTGIGPLEINRPIDLIQREIEILDDHDQSLDWGLLRPPSEGQRGRMRLQVQLRNPGEPLDFAGLKLRVFTMVGAAAEVPFSFADVPLP
jgi:hypothetical protein